MKKEEKKRIRTRGWLLLGLFFVLYVALLSRAVQIQFFSARSLKDLAVRQHTTVLTLQPERGQILDRHGTVLAASLLVDSLWADPQDRKKGRNGGLPFRRPGSASKNGSGKTVPGTPFLLDQAHDLAGAG